MTVLCATRHQGTEHQHHERLADMLATMSELDGAGS
jgi:hypothetical protein